MKTILCASLLTPNLINLFFLIFKKKFVFSIPMVESCLELLARISVDQYACVVCVLIVVIQ